MTRSVEGEDSGEIGGEQLLWQGAWTRRDEGICNGGMLGEAHWGCSYSMTLRVYGDAGYGNLEYYSNNFIIGGDGRVNNSGDGGAETKRRGID
eukprot:scaffold92601_cov75-Cyclotella_meneghiniana.AAC.7